MRRTRFDEWPCPVARATDLLGDWWTPLILRDACAGSTRFDQFQSSLDVPRAVLTARLARLVDEGLLVKSVYQEHPVRHEYLLTAKGRDFWPILAAMWRWGEDWMWPDGDQPPVALKRRSSGDVVRPAIVDELTGEPIGLEDVRVGRNPAASTASAD